MTRRLPSELGQALQIASAMRDQVPAMLEERASRASDMIRRLPLSTAEDVLTFLERVSLGDTLPVAALKATGKRVHVAEWILDGEHRCQHRIYRDKPTREGMGPSRAGGIPDGDLQVGQTWLEAWIA